MDLNNKGLASKIDCLSARNNACKQENCRVSLKVVYVHVNRVLMLFSYGDHKKMKSKIIQE